MKKIVVEDPNEAIKKKDSSKDSQVKQSKDKVSIFKFGDTAQKTVSGATNVQEKDKLGKYVKCELCDYRCEKLPMLKKALK